MPRLFRYSSDSYGNLRANSPHMFAQRHALSIYRPNAVYSFIPKNACSTMRTSLAVANGCIRDSSDFNWIHQNNDTFSASLRELARAEYTFVILRCPYARLLSVYLDKILNRNPQAWRYVDLHQRAIDLDDVTFEFFVKSMLKKRVRNADIHWMPQLNFLVYRDYDDYFAFEDMPALAATLKAKIDFDLIDARALTRHGRENYRTWGRKEPFRLAPLELLAAKKRGSLPSIRSMYNDELIGCVKRAYKQDIAFYKKTIGADSLTFA